MGLSSDSRVVVYMGDSSGDGCLYKFVSNGTFDATRGLNNSDLLNSGALYAADLAMGQWIELTVENVKRELNRSDLQIPNTISYGVDQLRAMFQEQTDVLAHAHEAALVLGATPLDRQGGLVLHPADRSLFVSLTGNDRHGNMHGQIIRLIENDGDAGAAEFEFEQIASGGRQSGFSSPAGIAFDRSGQLWVASAIHSAKLHQGAYRTFENNGLYVLPLQDGPDAVTQFAAAPVEAALAAPAFTPNEQTLFIAVQHPGDRSTDPAKATSLWPHRSGDTMPRPALAAVTRTR
jgi:secreted PhoX family phosphatase